MENQGKHPQPEFSYDFEETTLTLSQFAAQMRGHRPETDVFIERSNGRYIIGSEHFVCWKSIVGELIKVKCLGIHPLLLPEGTVDAEVDFEIVFESETFILKSKAHRKKLDRWFGHPQLMVKIDQRSEMEPVYSLIAESLFVEAFNKLAAQERRGAA